MLRALFTALGLAFVFWKIVPFEWSPGSTPGPDIFYCITMAYVIRRPEYAPVWLIFAVFFMRDVLTLAPIGLFSLFMVVGTEVVRSNLQAFREYIFGMEWLWIASIFTVITLVQQVMLGLMLANTPRFVDQLLLILFTVLSYPVIVGIMKYGFGFDRPQPGATDAWGKPL